MALFENSDITLLRYNSGIFFWFHFIAAVLDAVLLTSKKYIKKGENIFMLTFLQFYEHVHYSLLFSRFSGFHLHRCLQQVHLT